MKTRFLILIVFLAVAQLGLPQQPNPPLTKDQVMDLVKFGMDSSELAKRIKERGLDFEPTDDYVEALRKAGAQEPVIRAIRELKPKPLNREQVGELIAGGVPSERAAALVKQHGVDFQVDDKYLDTLRVAGADDTLIAALREASAAVTSDLLVETSSNATVYLDGELKGRAGPDGHLQVQKVKPGVHAIKVSLDGKKDFQENVRLTAAQVTTVAVTLGDLAGSIRVQTLASAEVFLDNSSRGAADTSGQIVIPGIAGGAHELRVTAEGKKEFRQSITVIGGEESRIDAGLAEIEEPNPSSKIWHSEATQHDFRVEVTNDVFRAEWINIPPAIAKRGAYIRTECRRAGTKWEGVSHINLLFGIPGAPAGNNTKMCSLTVRFEVDSISPEQITGHSEVLRSFDVNTCRVKETRWGELTWVPKE
jgi:hypothetical protein